MLSVYTKYIYYRGCHGDKISESPYSLQLDYV